MKNKIKRILRRLAQGRFVVVLSVTYQMIMWIEYYYFRIKWMLTGKKKPNQQEIELIKENKQKDFSFQNIYVSVLSNQSDLCELENLLSSINQEFENDISVMYTTIENDSFDFTKIILLGL